MEIWTKHLEIFFKKFGNFEKNGKIWKKIVNDLEIAILMKIQLSTLTWTST